MNKPLIVITNDDGIEASGIRFMVEAVKDIGKVVVIAPNRCRSGMAHAITIDTALEIYPTDTFADMGIKAYVTSGMPVDCIKLAKHYLFKNEKIDLVVSGINHGSNTSISVLYSGTIAAAVEATVESIPSVAFSLCSYEKEPYFKHTREAIQEICQFRLSQKKMRNVTLNVNFPNFIPNKKIKGIKICQQAKAIWKEQFEKEEYSHGRKKLQLAGTLVSQDDGENTDIHAIKNYWISMVPILIDKTDYKMVEYLKKSKLFQ